MVGSTAIQRNLDGYLGFNTSKARVHGEATYVVCLPRMFMVRIDYVRRPGFMLEPKDGLGFKSLYPAAVSRSLQDNPNAQKKPATTVTLQPSKVCSGIGCSKVSRGSRLLDGDGLLIWAGCSSCAKRQPTPSGATWKRYYRSLSKRAKLRAAGL